MARGINKVILVGNLGNDPETKYTQGGMAITTLSLATTSVRKDKEGQQIEKTEWHRVKLFGKVGEIAGEYLKKGRSVYVDGRLPNTPDNLAAWIVDPHAIDPQNAMPPTGVSPSEARDMAAYLYTLD